MLTNGDFQIVDAQQSINSRYGVGLHSCSAYRYHPGDNVWKVKVTYLTILRRDQSLPFLSFTITIDFQHVPKVCLIEFEDRILIATSCTSRTKLTFFSVYFGGFLTCSQILYKQGHFCLSPFPLWISLY